ncbi:MAG: dihydropteroate synthase [Lachnospiraceae bacterium]|nr:dihydropteroate synthase [Lachnospiraceae bacterium]
MKIGCRKFDTERHTYVMGILNVTPDSFSDGGKYMGTEAALRRAGEMIREGADIIDIGGQSTRPGFTFVTEDEEISRIVPVIEAIKKEYDVPVSADTFNARTAEEAVRAGCDMINDIWGLSWDPRMAEVIARSGACCCLMNNREEAFPQDMPAEEMLVALHKELEEIKDRALRAGIKEDRIILDPGIGFAKDPDQNLAVLGNLGRFRDLGLPMLLGASRKSVIGKATGAETADRLPGTIVTTVLAVQAGYSFVRVHDVKENLQAILMAEAVR